MPITKITSKAVEADAKYIIDVDTVDGKHAYTTPTANHLLTLDGSGNLPTDITGDADTVDDKHWADFKYVSATLTVGNQYSILVAGERAIVYIPSDMTLREIQVREIGEISGSATLNLYVYDGTSDMTESLIVACSLSSQNYRSITGRSDTFQAGDWIALFVTGTSTDVKRVAVGLRFERT